MSSAEETNALTRFFFLQEQLVVCYLFCPQFGESLPLREREREILRLQERIHRRRRSMATRTNAKIHHNWQKKKNKERGNRNKCKNPTPVGLGFIGLVLGFKRIDFPSFIGFVFLWDWVLLYLLWLRAPRRSDSYLRQRGIIRQGRFRV